MCYTNHGYFFHVCLFVSLQAEAVLEQQPQLLTPAPVLSGPSPSCDYGFDGKQDLPLLTTEQLGRDTSVKRTPHSRSQLSGNGFLLGVA